MSSYKYWWRPNVERALKEYPNMKKRKKELQQPKITPNYSGMPGGGDVSNPTEDLALRQLPESEERWIRAIEAALSDVAQQSDGADVAALINSIYFAQTHTLAGAAGKYNMSVSTAKRRVGRFIYLVALHEGHLKIELPEPEQALQLESSQDAARLSLQTS